MPEHLDPGELRQLQAAARTFTTSPRSFLKDAAQSLRRHGDPLVALELLAHMRGTAQEKRALHEVGHWLEQRLVCEPHVRVDRLLQELGWLQRIDTIVHDSKATAPVTETGPHRHFGERIEQLRKARAAPAPAKRPTMSPAELDALRRQERVEALLRSLRPENASTSLPELLGEPDLDKRRGLAERCVELLTRKRVRAAQKDKKLWVRPLTEVLGPL